MTAPKRAEELIGRSDAPLVAVNRGRLCILVLNRPRQRNAMTREMRRRFASMMQSVDADPAIDVVIITGTGEAFCAGADLKERTDPPQPLVRPNPGEVIRAMTKPVIAAVDGPCITGGLEIALSCSFVIASHGARFADTHAKLGLFPAWGLSALLPAAIGVRRARQMSLTSMFVDSSTAYEWGLVNEVIPRDELLPRCVALAELIAANDRRSVRSQLQLINRMDGSSRDVALRAEEQELQRWRAGEPGC